MIYNQDHQKITIGKENEGTEIAADDFNEESRFGYQWGTIDCSERSIL